MSVHIPSKLAHQPEIIDCGSIPNLAEFSRVCDGLYGKRKGYEGPLATPDGKTYDLCSIPAQFHSTARMAISIHQQDRAHQTNCMVHLNQGLLHPGEYFRVGPWHIDAPVTEYPNNPYPDQDVFVVSDAQALTTIFARQTFRLPEASPTAREDLNWKLCEILEAQIDPNKQEQAKAGHLMRFGSYAVHRAVSPHISTNRSFMMIRFF